MRGEICRPRDFPNCLVMTQLGKSGQLSASDVIGDHQVSFTMHLGLRFNHSCGVRQLHNCVVPCDFRYPSFVQTCPNPLSATAQLYSRTISPKVVHDLVRNFVFKAHYIIQRRMRFCKPRVYKVVGISQCGILHLTSAVA